MASHRLHEWLNKSSAMFPLFSWRLECRKTLKSSALFVNGSAQQVACKVVCRRKLPLPSSCPRKAHSQEENSGSVGSIGLAGHYSEMIAAAKCLLFQGNKWYPTSQKIGNNRKNTWETMMSRLLYLRHYSILHVVQSLKNGLLDSALITVGELTSKNPIYDIKRGFSLATRIWKSI